MRNETKNLNKGNNTMTIEEMTDPAYKNEKYNKLAWVTNKLSGLIHCYMRENGCDSSTAEYYVDMNNEKLVQIQGEEIKFFRSYLKNNNLD